MAIEPLVRLNCCDSPFEFETLFSRLFFRALQSHCIAHVHLHTHTHTSVRFFLLCITVYYSTQALARERAILNLLQLFSHVTNEEHFYCNFLHFLILFRIVYLFPAVTSTILFFTILSSSSCYHYLMHYVPVCVAVQFDRFSPFVLNLKTRIHTFVHVNALLLRQCTGTASDFLKMKETENTIV